MAESNKRLVEELQALREHVAALEKEQEERQRTEQELLHSLQTSADIMRSIPAGLFVYQYRAPESLTLLDGNAEAQRLTGLDPAVHRGTEFDAIWPRARDGGLTQRVLEVMHTGHVYEVEEFAYQDETLTGVYRIRAFPMPGERLGVAFEDVTGRKQAETERDRLFDLSLDMLCIVGFDGYFRQVNPAWHRILGWSQADLLSRPWREFVHPEDLAATMEADEWLRADKSVEAFENRYRCADGSYRRLSWNSYPLPEGGLIYSVARDITEKVALEAQLRHSQKMEAVGQLAGGVAHDFNNILTTILGNVELALGELERRPPAGGALFEELQEIEHGARRASALTRQLLAFSRRQISQPQVLDLNQVVAGMERMLGRLITEDIKLEVVYAPKLHAVQADPGQIEQVVVNLVLNARDAMRDGGTLVVETTNVNLDEAYVARHAKVRPGRYVMLAVSDTGCGMDAVTMERIFEPFFTTKGMGKGTGLGLATVYGIVKQTAGHVMARSEPGRGSSVEVYLPAIEASVQPRRAGGAEAQVLAGSETILVCEDDPAVRGLMVEALAQAGYAVIAAENGDRALESAAQSDRRIELLVTDVIMPGMNGKKLADALRATTPRLKELFVSGYTSDVIAHHGVLDEGVQFLEKPFNRQTLLRRVREVLDG